MVLNAALKMQDNFTVAASSAQRGVVTLQEAISRVSGADFGASKLTVMAGGLGQAKQGVADMRTEQEKVCAALADMQTAQAEFAEKAVETAANVGECAGAQAEFAEKAAETAANVGECAGAQAEMTDKAAETAEKIEEIVGAEASLADKVAETTGKMRDSADAAEEVGKKTSAAEGCAKLLKEAWNGVKKAASEVGKVLQFADGIAATNAQLNRVNDGLQTSKELQGMVMDAANKSRVSYEAMAGTVAALGSAAGSAFGSTGEMVSFAELMNEQFALAGMSASESEAAVAKLAEAMADGAISGEEMNALFGEAPNLVQTIADYMGLPVEQVRNLAAEGQISADTLKNATLAASGEIGASFGDIPMTWDQVWTQAQNRLEEAFTPMIEAISGAAEWVGENWGTLEPIITGIATAVGILVGAYEVWNIVQGISSTLTAIAAASSAMKAGASLAEAAATETATGAQVGLNAALLANPLTWIIVAIVAVIAAIVAWVDSVGGLQNAWEICKAAITVAWAALKVAFFTAWNWIADLIDKISLAFVKMGVGIGNTVDDLRASALMGLQNLVNGAIDIINSFINTINKVLGTNIQVIQQVTFGTTAAIEAEANKQAREQELADYEAAQTAAKNDRDKKLAGAQDDLNAALTTLNDLYNGLTNPAEDPKGPAQNPGDDGPGKDPKGPGGDDPLEPVTTSGGGGGGGKAVRTADQDKEDTELLKLLVEYGKNKAVQNFITLQPQVALSGNSFNTRQEANPEELATWIGASLGSEVATQVVATYAFG